MKQKKVRLLGLLLAAVMLLGCLPVQALAAEGGWFYLAADWNGTLLIAPERVSFRRNVSVRILGMTLSYICQKAQMDKNARPTRIVRR